MKSIRGRLEILLLTVITLILAAGGLAIYEVAKTALANQFDDALDNQAHTLSSLITFEVNELIFDEGDVAHEPFEAAHYEIRTEFGELLVRSPALGKTELPFRAPPEDAPEHEDCRLSDELTARLVWFTFLPHSEHPDESLIGLSPAEADERRLDPPAVAPERLVIALAADRAPVDQPLAVLLGAIVAVGTAVELAVCIVVAFGVQWGLRPLTNLAREISQISGRIAARRFDDADGPRELKPIREELNRMLDRVERTLDRERTFADAAAHELRTPLAELRAAAEVASRWPDAKPAQTALVEILDIGAEMERLVESLLLVSRAQHCDNSNDNSHSVLLASLINDILDQVRPEIENKQLCVWSDVPAGLSLSSSPDAWRIILRNLVDNAIEHTPPSGFVSLRIAPEREGGSTLIVENGPVRLEEEDVTNLFVPFWRRETSRTDRRHVGLGLTIVQQLATAFGAQVSAQLIPDGLRINVCYAAAGR